MRSMTGFGGGRATADGVCATCELRSVNGKGLDIRMRLPAGLERLDPELRKRLRGSLSRGNVQVVVAVERGDADSSSRVDHDVLDRLVSDMREAAARHSLAMPDLGAFLAQRGVVRTDEATDDPEAQADVVLAAFADALSELEVARVREGKTIATLLEERLDVLCDLTESARNDPSRDADNIRDRLMERISQLADVEALDGDRLHAEAALLAVRADVAEEIERLTAHVQAARELLLADRPVGRRLEFLVQEMAREANTLCAKSNAAALTAIGLELKIAIDQMREQIANVE